jgi:hypothetical protein
MDFSLHSFNNNAQENSAVSELIASLKITIPDIEPHSADIYVEIAQNKSLTAQAYQNWNQNSEKKFHSKLK